MRGRRRKVDGDQAVYSDPYLMRTCTSTVVVRWKNGVQLSDVRST